VPPNKDIYGLTGDRLIALVTDLGKRWLALDGLWFQAIEKEFGMDKAMSADMAVWQDFSALEARRIKDFLELPEQGGLGGLELALQFRLYSFINEQEIISQSENQFLLRMKECRVQNARKRKNMAPFPCKSIGVIEYSVFASTIDSRINTRCVSCPPDNNGSNCFCEWEFTLDQ